MILHAAITALVDPIVAASPIPPVAPNMDDLPGGPAVRQVINGIAGLMLAACTIAFLYGAGQAAVGGQAGNSHVAADGRKKMMLAPIFAACIIAAPTILNFAVTLGKKF